MKHYIIFSYFLKIKTSKCSFIPCLGCPLTSRDWTLAHQEISLISHHTHICFYVLYHSLMAYNATFPWFKVKSVRRRWKCIELNGDASTFEQTWRIWDRESTPSAQSVFKEFLEFLVQKHYLLVNFGTIF